MSRTAGVTGATGFVGRYVVRELLANGWSVRALARDASKAARVLPGKGEGVEVVEGDAADPGVLGSLLEGCAAAIALVGIIREAPGGQTFRRLHVESRRAIVEACLAKGVRRLVAISAVGASRQGVSEYLRSKREGEEIVMRSGLDWTILRPGLIHGAEGEFVRLMKGWATRAIPPHVFLPYFARGVDDSGVFLGPIRYEAPRVAPVSVRDVAEATVRVLDRRATHSEIYNLVGPDEMSFPEMLRAFRDGLPGGDPKLHPVGIPAEVAAAAATAASLIGLGSLVPFDAGMARMGAEDTSASNDKAEAHFEFSPRPFREELASYAGRV